MPGIFIILVTTIRIACYTVQIFLSSRSPCIAADRKPPQPLRAAAVWPLPATLYTASPPQ